MIAAFFYATPTTLFADKDGYLYDQILTGADIDQYKEKLQILLEEQ